MAIHSLCAPASIFFFFVLVFHVYSKTCVRNVYIYVWLFECLDIPWHCLLFFAHVSVFSFFSVKLTKKHKKWKRCSVSVRRKARAKICIFHHLNAIRLIAFTCEHSTKKYIFSSQKRILSVCSACFLLFFFSAGAEKRKNIFYQSPRHAKNDCIAQTQKMDEYFRYKLFIIIMHTTKGSWKTSVIETFNMEFDAFFIFMGSGKKQFFESYLLNAFFINKKNVCLKAQRIFLRIFFELNWCKNILKISEYTYL